MRTSSYFSALVLSCLLLSVTVTANIALRAFGAGLLLSTLRGGRHTKIFPLPIPIAIESKKVVSHPVHVPVHVPVSVPVPVPVYVKSGYGGEHGGGFGYN
ncbi:uncharacterized protein LOC143231419 isoform X2 [Tachypleus tridentatus]